MTKIWRKMQKISNIFHYFLTSGYSGFAKFTPGCENITMGWLGFSKKLLGLVKKPSGRVKFRVGFWPDPSHNADFEKANFKCIYKY